MSRIDDYQELIAVYDPENAANYPKMSDSFLPNRYDGQEQVIAFLRSGELGSMPVGFMVDVISGEQTTLRDSGRSFGSYSWGEGLAYYVDKYNLKLPDDITEFILNQS